MHAVMTQHQTPPWPPSADIVIQEIQRVVAACWSWDTDFRPSIQHLCTQVDMIIEDAMCPAPFELTLGTSVEDSRCAFHSMDLRSASREDRLP